MPLLQIKSCSKCGEIKPTSRFAADKRNTDGLQSQCRACCIKRSLEWQQANQEKRAVSCRKWKKANPEKAAAQSRRFYKKHTQACKARSARFAKEHPEIGAAQAMKRKARELQAMPKWADQLAIKSIYKEARRLTKETGIIHHVDHFYPLGGKTVSGLHVEFNLRAIPRTENQQKYNKTPEEFYAS